MTAQTKKIKTSGGIDIVIREPSPSGDLDRLVSFFSSLPPKVKNYLRYDATDRSVCQSRLSVVDDKNHWRLIAEIDGDIVADATLDREPFGWTRHVAHLRVVLDPEFAQKGIKTALIRELVERGGDAGVERFYVEVLKHQKNLIASLESIGFTYEATRKNFAKDAKGRAHDVVILSNDRGAIWSKLVSQIEDADLRVTQIMGNA